MRFIRSASLQSARASVPGSLHCASAVGSFRIRQLASSEDRLAKLVELEEVSGDNGQDQLGGPHTHRDESRWRAFRYRRGGSDSMIVVLSPNALLAHEA